METKFDTVIIGSGVAGLSIAYGLAAADKKVAIIEEDLWGGTCPNRGCDPKKVLVSAVEAKESVNRLIGKSFSTAPNIHWPELMAFKKTFTNPVPKKSQEGLQSSGIETIHGTAQFIDSHKLQVNDHLLSADQFVLATGARPSILGIEGKEHFLTSDDFLSLPEMPETVTFVGGGYIAFEFAAIASAAGAKVHIIHHNERPLKAFDGEFVDLVMQQLEEKGVTFHLNIDIQKIDQQDNQFLLTDTEDFSLNSDLVFCTAGRIPNTEKLQLEKAGVEFNKHGITVNDYLQTTNPDIFACGDVLDKSHPKLTPVSTFEASYVTSYLTGKTTDKIVYPTIPTVTFTSPKLTQVGVTAAEANKPESMYELSVIDATQWFSYHRVNEPISKVKIITDKKTGLLAGAICLNDEADTLINYMTLLIEKETPAKEVANMVFTYPTIASDLPSLYS